MVLLSSCGDKVKVVQCECYKYMHSSCGTTDCATKCYAMVGELKRERERQMCEFGTYHHEVAIREECRTMNQE